MTPVKWIGEENVSVPYCCIKKPLQNLVAENHNYVLLILQVE